MSQLTRPFPQGTITEPVAIFRFRGAAQRQRMSSIWRSAEDRSHADADQVPHISMVSEADGRSGGRKTNRSSQTSSMRQPLYWLLTMTVSPSSCGCMQVAERV